MECKHTKQPKGYVHWYIRAEKKSKTHIQKRCRVCGLRAVREKKREIMFEYRLHLPRAPLADRAYFPKSRTWVTILSKGKNA